MPDVAGDRDLAVSDHDRRAVHVGEHDPGVGNLDRILPVGLVNDPSKD
jgi:hypothetical protein